jgi:hypothetical protein
MVEVITDAVVAYKREGMGGVEKVFATLSSSHLGRLRFDFFLLNTGDQLADCAGPVEDRFKARVLAMALNRPAVGEDGEMNLEEGGGNGES